MNTNALSLLYWFDIWLGKKIWELVLISFLVLVSRYRRVAFSDTTLPTASNPKWHCANCFWKFARILLAFQFDFAHTRGSKGDFSSVSEIKEDSKLFRRQWLRMCWHRRRGSIGGEVETPRLVDGDFSDRLGSSHVTPCGWRAFGHTDLGENNTTLSSTYCHKKVTMGFLAVSPISLNVERLD